MAHFDWWQGTLHGGSADQVIAGLLQVSGEFVDVAPSRAHNGYLRGAALRRGDRVLCRVMWDGNPGVHVIASGSDAPTYAPFLRDSGFLPTRVDAAEDWVQPGLADRMFDQAIKWAMDRGIKMETQGDWPRGVARTLYLGSRKSVGFIRLYEKGHQVGNGADPNWVRLEVELHPKRNREQVAALQPGQLFGVVTWIREYVDTCLGWSHLDAVPTGTVWQPSDAEKARLALLRQYRKILASWADEVGGWESLGKEMEAALMEL